MIRIAILLACVLASCGNPSGGEVPPGQAPTITAFTATPGTITAGASTTLAWTVSGATALRLDGIGAVTGTSTTLAPTATTTYHLVAENDAGAATADATVIVNPVPGTEATDHPRLWIRSADLPRLRGWAVATNPTWLDLQRLATRAKADMDAGHVAEDDGSAHYVSYPTETYAQLFAFMSLVDPAVAPIDPHATAPTRHVAPGIGRVLARTAWTDDASWFTWSLGWQGIDHQDGDGNAFELYRHGEFLTKKRIGYGYGYETSDNSNTLAIENDPPDHMDYRALLWQRGSQWPGDNDGDPTIVALSTGDPRFVAATGDATTLYDSAHELSQDVQHASRSIVWLAPDHVVIYDRATTGKADRFKRFWMGTPALATVAGARATMLSPGGQQLFVSSLLPTTAVVTAQAWPDEDDVAGGTPAEFEAMRYRIAIEDPAKPADVRFLTVVQGADAGATASPTARIASTAGAAYAGARVGTTAVLFKVNLTDAFTSTTYTVAGATTHLVTGLAPQSGYTVTRSGDTVTVTAGGSSMADAGGVLIF